MTSHSRFKLSRWYIPIGLLLLALLPRLPALGYFLTLDEFFWVERSRHFLAGLLNPGHVCQSPLAPTRFERMGLACTLQTGHPGVTTMWTGSLGLILRYLADGAPSPLLDYALSTQTNPLEPGLVAPARLPTVLLTSLWVVVMYWLVSQLFADRRVGLAAGLLLALDPFHVALSRIIHHDALSTTFMTLSLLTAMIYWGQRKTGRWLITSGALAGLAFLSKSLALFLIPFAVLLAGWSLVVNWQSRGASSTWQRVTRAIVEWMLWFDCAALVFIALWPAMWVIPARTLRTILLVSLDTARAGHPHYFLGKISLDPGLLFYPVTWLLRSSPLVWIGLVLAVLPMFRRSQAQPQPIDESESPHPAGLLRTRWAALGTDKPLRRYLPLLLLYAVLFVAFMDLSANKQDRFILPIYPALSVVAAVGLVQIPDLFKKKLPEESRRAQASWRGPALLGLIALFQAVITFMSYPYYFTYYNPLLGGARTAEKLVTLGWGEGFDLAAAYLNQKPNAEQLRVGAWLDPTFAPYFRGHTTGSFTEFATTDHMMRQDYLVVYVTQRQLRHLEHMLTYFKEHHSPEYTVRLQGVDYALIYAVPIQRHTAWQLPQDVASHKLILYGYRQAGSQPGLLRLILVWQNRDMSREDGLWAALQVPSDSKPLSWGACALAPGFSAEEAQQVGALLESVCELETGDLRPGIYNLRIGLGPAANKQALGLPGKLNQPEGMFDLLTRESKWEVSIPSAGPPTLVAPDQD